MFATACAKPQVQTQVNPVPNPTNVEVKVTPPPGVVQTDEAVKEINLIIGHTFYNPSEITAKKGQKLRINAIAASGTSGHNHGVTIDAFGINEAVTTEDPNNPKVIEFTPDRTGTFTIYCKTCLEGPFADRHPKITGTLIVE